MATGVFKKEIMKKQVAALVLAAMGAMPAAVAQRTYSMMNAHSHNDYERSKPFYEAVMVHFGSVEADVHLKDGKLYVAHDAKDIDTARTFDRLYVQPIIRQFAVNHGRPYENEDSLQLLVDLKTAGPATLAAVQQALLPYRKYFDRSVNPYAVKVVISGNKPTPAHWDEYDKLFFFDGDYTQTYTPAQHARIDMVSVDFGRFSNWNGKGTMVPVQLKKVKGLVDKMHAAGFRFRYWGAPSTPSTYYKLMEMGVDWIGTDHPEELYGILHGHKQNTVANLPVHAIYQPTYASDATGIKSKNVIFMIGDGTGLAQQFAGATANHGLLNLFTMKQIGLSETQSADDYDTDSAAGATAFATGQKTNNRVLGMDKTYTAIPNLADTLVRSNIKSGVLVTEEISGATPAAFYAHTPDRDSVRILMRQLVNNPNMQLAVGSGMDDLEATLEKGLKDTLSARNITLFHNISDWATDQQGRTLVLLRNNDLQSMTAGRGNYLVTALKKALAQLNASGHGFFLMVEGSLIDVGGHKNNLEYLVREMLDFDEAIGEALKFADTDGHTTVIVTADHETSGLALMDGKISEGRLSAHFSTNDHTGIPVPVFAYGPGSALFRGVYQNNEIYGKILDCFFK